MIDSRLSFAFLVLCLVSPAPVGALPARGPCAPPATTPGPLAVKDGFVEFMEPARLAPFKAALPKVADGAVDAILRSPETMWYDEPSMVFLYQDSVETVVGGRANCVGRKVGEANANHPEISKLMKYFGPDFRFGFPFRTAAGTDRVTNVQVVNFWSPPKAGGAKLPVKWWRPTPRGRWHWTFPVGTVFGEVLYQKAPDGRLYVFEIRTRKRYLDGWEVDLFRPFTTAAELAAAIRGEEPAWAAQASLATLVRHLDDATTLVPHRLQSAAYGKIFPAVDGALDVLPDAGNPALVAKLLTSRPFVSTEGAIWKEGRGLETYAPGSAADFHVVPRGYEMGMIPVNEVSCNRCHSETGRRLGDLEFPVIAYGEVWGEDRIFTWHLFEPNPHIYDTWDDADVSRKLSSRLLTARLLRNEKPATGDPLYKPLPGPYYPDRRQP